MNPLIEDLTNLKDNDIENKIQDLSKKYWMTQNPAIKSQISNFLNIYQEELKMRRAKSWDQQYQKRNKDLDNLIQVN